MVKVLEVEVICPDCGLRQKYHSHQEKVKNKRRKTCNTCGRSFKVKDQEADKIKKDNDKPTTFHKYRRK